MAIGNPITLTNNVASKIISVTATADQTLFTVTGGYRINQLAVFRNGVRLAGGTGFTANDGATVTLLTAASADDTVEFQIFDDFRVADAIQSAVATQTISGDLTVTGTIVGMTSVTGSTIGIQSAGTLIGTAQTINFIGTGNTFAVSGSTVDISIAGGGGGSGIAATITVADESTDTTCFPVFVTDATGNVNPKSGSNLTFNSSSGALSATSFVGDVTGDVTGNADTATTATNAQGLTGTPDIAIRNITGVAATFTGVLTYEDVTNIDSVGIVTARTGIKVLAGGINAVGVVTGTTGVQVGSGQSFGANGPTAVYYGDGSNLTGISAGITTTKYSPTANAIIQIGLGTAQHHELTLTAGFTTITTSGGSFGESHSLVLIQPSSGIATVGFSTFFQFPSGATPSMSEGSSKVDLVSFVVKDIAGNTGTGATELLASAGLNYS